MKPNISSGGDGSITHTLGMNTPLERSPRQFLTAQSSSSARFSAVASSRPLESKMSMRVPSGQSYANRTCSPTDGIARTRVSSAGLLGECSGTSSSCTTPPCELRPRSSDDESPTAATIRRPFTKAATVAVVPPSAASHADSSFRYSIRKGGRSCCSVPPLTVLVGRPASLAESLMAAQIATWAASKAFFMVCAGAKTRAL
mmetsp:Transcript_15892/g.26410  ORF Transcript_15892/g.26410 Transcript_15892/m.26410 type:complete len:201 (-) Transcript_15892:571-1173(-)